MSKQKKIIQIGIDHTATLRQLDVRVRQCCRHCEHLRQELEDDEGTGIYTHSFCGEFAKIAGTFTWVTRKPDLLVSLDLINNCGHYKQKKISDTPLFEAATSA